MKRLIIILLLISGVGVGLWVLPRKGHVEGDRQADWPPPRVTERPEQGDRIAAHEITESKLQGVISHSTDHEIEKAARALFANLRAADMKSLQPMIDEVTEKLYDNHEKAWIPAHAFYRRWGELDPDAALESLSTHESFWASLEGIVYEGWARTDPRAAFTAYDPSLESKYSNEIRNGILDGLSRVDPVMALQFAGKYNCIHEHVFQSDKMYEALENDRVKWEFLNYASTVVPDKPFQKAMREWMRSNPEAAFKEISKLSDLDSKRVAYSELFANWILVDADDALKSFSGIEDPYLRERAICHAMEVYLLEYPEKALMALVEIPGFVDDMPDFTVVSKYGGLPFPHSFHTTTKTTNYSRYELISDSALAMGIADGRNAWDIAMRLDDEADRAAALGGALAGWMISDLDAAADFVDQGLKSGSFANQISSELPDYAAPLTAKMLVRKDFDSTTKWVESLPDGYARDAAIKSTITTYLDDAWHRLLYENTGKGWEIQEAAELAAYKPVMDWLAVMPPSKGREDGLYWLGAKLDSHHDLRPALKYAGMMEDQRLRGFRFDYIAKELKKLQDKGESNFNLEAWSAANPELAQELKRAMEKNEN